jgi:signal transduction histidine kinase
MTTPLRALIAENSEEDVECLLRELQRGGFAPEFRRVETAQEMDEALRTGPWDIVIADFSLQQFSGFAALQLMKSRGLDLPCIIISDDLAEETAVAAMDGAHDFLVKGRYARLVPAIRRELREAAVRRERREAEAALRAAHEDLRATSARLLAAQEDERRRIAHELHDEIGQSLTGAQLLLGAMRNRVSAPDAASNLEECAAIIDRTLGQVRDLSLDLRPPQLDDFGLAEAVRWQLERQSRAAGLKGHFSADPIPANLRPEVEIACYRTAQEALTNVARHANAANVWITLRVHDTALELLVRDDGGGFDVALAYTQSLRGHSMGLAGMLERVELADGHLEFHSESNGTEIRAAFPHGFARQGLTGPGCPPPSPPGPTD